MIRHFGSDQKYELPLKWDASGIAETTWSIPKEGRLGTYQIYFQAPSENDASEMEGYEYVPGMQNTGFLSG